MLKNNKKFTVALITLIAALGGFLFGFDMAVVSGIIEPLKLEFGLTSSQEGLFVSSALLGCIAGVAFSGYLSDKIGRKKVLFIAAILFLLSAIGFSFSTTYPSLMLFRILAGIGVGVASNISPLYISEIAPAKNRGRLVTFYQLAITFGILVAYISNVYLERYISVQVTSVYPLIHWIFSEHIWRGMFLVGIIPASLFCFALFFVPESPRWLVQAGFFDEAFNTLKNVNENEKAVIEFNAIKEASTHQKGTIRELLHFPLNKMLWMAVILTALSQFSGINAVIFYGPTILKSAGIETSDALLYQVIFGSANMIFTFIAIWKVDSWGRRSLYMIGSLSAAVALSLTATCFLLNIHGWPMLLCIMLFLLFFAFSLGPLKFVIATEIFPTYIRGTAVSICIMTMWLSDWVVNLLFPILRDGLGVATTFYIFSFFCLISFFYSKIKLIETKGKTLEEISENSNR